MAVHMYKVVVIGQIRMKCRQLPQNEKYTVVLQLCSQCRPESYLHYKQQLVLEWERQGKLLADARNLKIDVNKRKICNFLLGISQ